LLALAPSALWGDKTDPIDYSKLDLSINLRSLRAGNHDPSGTNDYYFRTTLFGLPILKDEIKKTLGDRLKIELTQGEFGSLSIETLKYWQPEKKPQPGLSLDLSGDIFRKLVAETMRSFKVTEEQVAVLCQTEMFERNKKFLVFGEDIKVGETSFYLIPETLPHEPIQRNSELQIQDPLGTLVKLSIVFKQAKTTEVIAPPQANAP
jgi:hypothetical protein